MTENRAEMNPDHYSSSETKRNAWEEVREQLMLKFPGFMADIEEIKEHWRYRQQKVKKEMCKAMIEHGDNAETYLESQLSSVDLEIYQWLKESNSVALQDIKAELDLIRPIMQKMQQNLAKWSSDTTSDLQVGTASDTQEGSMEGAYIEGN